jgi:hypothetical protein
VTVGEPLVEGRLDGHPVLVTPLKCAPTEARVLDANVENTDGIGKRDKESGVEGLQGG